VKQCERYHPSKTQQHIRKKVIVKVEAKKPAPPVPMVKKPAPERNQNVAAKPVPERRNRS
jgi:hypothetical protein